MLQNRKLRAFVSKNFKIAKNLGIMKISDIQYTDYQDWEPKDYLTDYFMEIAPDDQFAMEFLVESLRKTESVPVALDFGCGPTVHHIFPVVPKAKEIHLAEYLPSNRDEVEKWLLNRNDAHDWRKFTLEILRLEGNPTPTEAEAIEREQQARDRITQVVPGDVAHRDPLGSAKREFYPLVTSHYCAEAATASKEKWYVYMQNLMSLVQSGGVLIISVCGAANFYRVGNNLFPCAGVNAQDVLACLKDNHFVDIDLWTRQIPDESGQGFSQLVYARAVKS
jgi:hypothetical protein